MKVGLSVYDLPARDLLDLAKAADELGFDALWLGEHLLLPMQYGSDHPAVENNAAGKYQDRPIIDPATELLEPMSALSAVGAVTTNLKLATGIYILPLRHPLLTARAACTVHEISDGRLMLGVGAGWLREEFDALDVPFDDRGSRVEESLAVLRAAFGGGPFTHHGRHFSFEKVQVTPRSAEVPLVLGGNTQRALRRAASLGDAWFSSGVPPLEDAVRLRDRLAELCTERGREPLPVYFRVESWDPDLIARYAAEGISNVVVWAYQVWPAGDSRSLAEKRDSLARAAERLGMR